MKHRADRPVDGNSRAGTHVAPRRNGGMSPHTAVKLAREEQAYLRWCHYHAMDPQDTESAIAYEGSVGWLYLDEPPEDHR